ncbi:hypothetical protein EDM57_08675 [Brevibacillus gelatini]|uniref:Bacterial EndoU nuclease domain-containing protein n=1 Tax=Brevibacillus gelatini TaxID=1655277 RepID=A0A3M8B4B1_9BACL|nr:hypothetical protein [Brevibacillus gelatini]RNB58170.1 hypothetical protein EDM57_08675 [Brevibacillus gelatini]
MKFKKSILTLLSAVLLSSTLIPSAFAKDNVIKPEKAFIQQTQSNEQENISNIEKMEKEESTESIKPSVAPIIPILIRAGVIIWRGYKTYEWVSEEIVEGAIEEHYGLRYASSNTSLMQYKVGNEVFHLRFGNRNFGLEHILGKHHPEYYYGIGFGSGTNTMFDPSITIEDIENMIAVISHQNKTRIERALRNDERVVVRGTWQDEEYRLVIDDGKVITLYPYGWNEAQYED